LNTEGTTIQWKEITDLRLYGGVEPPLNLRSPLNILSGEMFSVMQLMDIQRLDLTGNDLQILPRVICTLALRILNLSYNSLRTLPKTFGRCLEQLQWLDLNNNRLKSIPDEVLDSTSLQWLDVSWNGLKTLPDALGHKLKALKVFKCTHNSLETFPETITRLRDLVLLDFHMSALETLSPNIANLEQLRVLILSNNHRLELPSGIIFPRQLIKLDLHGNRRITLLPESLLAVKGLKKRKKYVVCGALQYHGIPIERIKDRAATINRAVTA